MMKYVLVLAALLSGGHLSLANATPISFDFRVERPESLVANWLIDANGNGNVDGSIKFNSSTNSVVEAAVQFANRTYDYVQRATPTAFSGFVVNLLEDSPPVPTGSKSVTIAVRDTFDIGNPVKGLVATVPYGNGNGVATVSTSNCLDPICSSNNGTEFESASGSITLDPTSVVKTLDSIILKASTVEDEIRTYRELKRSYEKDSNEWGSVSDGITSITLSANDKTELSDAAETREIDLIRTILNKGKGLANSIGTALIGELFAIQTKTATKGGENIFRTIANDPPRTDFHLTTLASGDILDFGFDDIFGVAYSEFDRFFIELGAGIEFNERSLVTAERLQGALLAGDVLAASLQLEHLEFLFEGSDTAFLNAQESLDLLLSEFPEETSVLENHQSLLSDTRLSTFLGDQDNTTPGPVPLPASGFLFLGVLGGTMVLRCRKRLKN